MKQARRARCKFLVSQADIYGKIDNNVFDWGIVGRKTKSRATNNIMHSILGVGYHKKKYRFTKYIVSSIYC